MRRCARVVVIGILGFILSTTSATPALAHNVPHVSPGGLGVEVSTTYPRWIESYERYDGAAYCVNTLSVGAKKLYDYLQWVFGDRPEELGVRTGDCNSEHGQGRALDYMTGSDTAKGNRIVAWLLNKDSRGNKHVLARRFGIMYINWNHHTYASYVQVVDGVSYAPFTAAPINDSRNPHTDHVHVSLSWRGASGNVTGFTTREFYQKHYCPNGDGTRTVVSYRYWIFYTSNGFFVQVKEATFGSNKLFDQELYYSYWTIRNDGGWQSIGGSYNVATHPLLIYGYCAFPLNAV